MSNCYHLTHVCYQNVKIIIHCIDNVEGWTCALFTDGTTHEPWDINNPKYKT